ncbi:valencene synthase-like [Eucalyptus grandis]|uniref:valencene synthase-like n=1 Tax=Eucalyptus grandis TaxID=71139 RepID=UPI00192EFDEE|nr:valencene synthase-like [Eucalyptus grandis]
MDKPSQKLNLIDQIQRLGLAYHFEIEIDEQLQQIHRSYFESHHGDNDDNLHMTALLFRLLRQQGYNVPCEIFNKFKDDEGNFSKLLVVDVQGVLSLFEACHLRFHGDDILNDALAFTKAVLESTDKGKVSRIYFEPAYEATREILTKVNVILTIMDDLYDGYGTLEELELFTEAIERWDVGANDRLPEYMQVFYKTVLDFYDEIGYELIKKGQLYRIFYAKEGMKNTVRAYLAEAKWFHQNYIPTMEEYMPVASVTIGCAMVMATSLLGMGDIVTKNEFDWLLFSDPKMVKTSNVVSRLMNDIAGHKSEQERGDAASSVECFMKQYRVTEEEAKEVLRKQVDDAWMDINEELCRPTVERTLLLVRILNFSRTFHVIYNDEKDHYSHAGTRFKELVTSLLVNPLPV